MIYYKELKKNQPNINKNKSCKKCDFLKMLHKLWFGASINIEADCFTSISDGH